MVKKYIAFFFFLIFISVIGCSQIVIKETTKEDDKSQTSDSDKEEARQQESTEDEDFIGSMIIMEPHRYPLNPGKCRSTTLYQNGTITDIINDRYKKAIIKEQYQEKDNSFKDSETFICGDKIKEIYSEKYDIDNKNNTNVTKEDPVLDIYSANEYIPIYNILNFTKDSKKSFYEHFERFYYDCKNNNHNVCITNKMSFESIKYRERGNKIDIKNKNTENIEIFLNPINPKKCISIVKDKNNINTKYINDELKKIIEMPTKISSENEKKYTQSIYICCGDQCIEKERPEFTYVSTSEDNIDTYHVTDPLVDKNPINFKKNYDHLKNTESEIKKINEQIKTLLDEYDQIEKSIKDTPKEDIERYNNKKYQETKTNKYEYYYYKEKLIEQKPIKEEIETLKKELEKLKKNKKDQSKLNIKSDIIEEIQEKIDTLEDEHNQIEKLIDEKISKEDIEKIYNMSQEDREKEYNISDEDRKQYDIFKKYEDKKAKHKSIEKKITKLSQERNKYDTMYIKIAKELNIKKPTAKIFNKYNHDIVDEININGDTYKTIEEWFIQTNNDNNIRDEIKLDLSNRLKIQLSKINSRIFEDPTVSNTHLIQSQSEEQDFIKEYTEENTYNTEAIIMGNNNKDIIGATAYLNKNNDQKCTAKIIKSDGTVEEFQGTQKDIALIYDGEPYGICGIKIDYVTACQNNNDNNKMIGIITNKEIVENNRQIISNEYYNSNKDICKYGKFNIHEQTNNYYKNSNKQKLMSFNEYTND